MATATTSSACWPSDRGDYDAAEPLYRRSLEISERDRRPGLAGSYHQLGILAQAGGTTTPPSRCTAGPWRSRSASATRPASPSYHQLGMLAQDRGTTTPPSRCTAGPWRSSASATRRASPAATTSSALAQARGDYDAAEPRYRRSLEIDERIGDRAAIAKTLTAGSEFCVPIRPDLREAIFYQVQGLAIHPPWNSAHPTAPLMCACSAERRAALGDPQFRHILRTLMDDNAAAAILAVTE